MVFNYNKLEKDLEDACRAVHREFMRKFDANNGHVSVGGAKLEAFINGLREEFESTAFTFLKRHNIEKDVEAKKRALAITKLYAKKCVEDFSKV